MDTTEISMLHHVIIVLFFLWLLYSFNWCSSIAFLVSFVYLLLVHERYIVRLRKKLQFEERKQANQKRVLSDSETVRWLNHAVEKIWPICMEKIVSRKILLPIIPWFLEKYKPWMAKKAVVQHMYLGRTPPMFTEMRVHNPSTGDDHLVLELGMNFRTADDMSTILVVKLRKRLGFGMWAKLHITGMHVEGKVLVGVKFLRHWPFIGRLRVCFSEPPYFQMTVKPLFTHGLDVTVLPGIAGWLDNLLALAFEQTLVQPNMLVVDMEKFVSPQDESWFSVYEKEPVAIVNIEVVEASDMKPSDLNGLADPYVKGQMGPYRFRTSTQKKTLSPKWQEEFKVPISSWDLPNLLAIEVRDKDHFVDDNLGNCTININDFGDGERHDLWLPLRNIKMGRIHLAITVVDENPKVSMPYEAKAQDEDERKNSLSDETTNRPSFSSITSDEPAKVSDKFEPINIEDQEEPGIWVYQPGTKVSPTWETRKGKGRRLDNPVERVPSGSSHANTSVVPDSITVSSDETVDGNSRKNSFQRGLEKIGSVFRKNSKGEGTENSRETVQSPYADISPVDEKGTHVRLVMEGTDPKILNSPNDKDMTKSIIKTDKKSLRKSLSKKESDKSRSDSSVITDREVDMDSDSSDDDSLSSPQVHKSPTIPNPMSCCFNGPLAGNNAPSRSISKKVSIEGQEKMHYDRLNSGKGLGTGLEGTSKTLVAEENLAVEKN